MRKALASILFTYTGVGWAPDALKTNKAKAPQGCTQWTHNHHTMHTDKSNHSTKSWSLTLFYHNFDEGVGRRRAETATEIDPALSRTGQSTQALPPTPGQFRGGCWSGRDVFQTETMRNFKTRPRRQSTGHGTRHDSTWLFRFLFHFHRKWRHRNNI